MTKKRRALQEVSHKGRPLAVALCLAAMLGIAAILAVGALAQSRPETTISRFERSDPVEQLFVEPGTAAADLALPGALRAVVGLPEGADPSAFVQADPAAGNGAGHGYAVPEGAYAAYAAGEVVVCSLDSPSGAQGRVWGTLPGCNGGAACWFACGGDGVPTGMVADVPVTWASGGYDAGVPGTYTFSASFADFDCAGARPWAAVTVETPAQAAARAIDALPSLEEAQAMDPESEEYAVAAEDARAAEELLSSLTAEMGDEDYAAFEAELGDGRMEKLYGLLDLFEGGPVAAPMAAGLPNPVNIAQGRLVFTNSGATQYSGMSNTVLYQDTVLKPSYTITGTVARPLSTVANSQRVIDARGVSSLNLTFQNLNVSVNQGTCTQTDPLNICCDVTHSNATITLKGSNALSAYGNDNCNKKNVGCLVKNGMDGSLTLRCEHADEPGHVCDAATCGSLLCYGSGGHVAAIGSVMPANPTIPAAEYEAQHGFANLYITGGIVTAQAGIHSPGIGSMCGPTYYRYDSKAASYLDTTVGGASVCDIANSEAGHGQYCSNIRISGGRVSAYGGDSCAGIGSGWAGKVDGVYISGGAYVHTEGGADSPGIGSGGNHSGGPVVPKTADTWHVSNVVVSGGGTVVEAIGGTSIDPAFPYTPCIGVGLTYQYPNAGFSNPMGTTTNVVASPDADWLACVKQGTTANPLTATYVAGSPSLVALPIATTQYYTLVYFARVSKTASVNGAAGDAGMEASPVAVSGGDTVTYTVDTGSLAEAAVTADVTDEVPAGMTLVTAPGTYTPGMTWATDAASGVTTVTWAGQSLTAANKSFRFAVTVDGLAPGAERSYVNKASVSYDGNVVESNKTYHRARVPVLTFTKTDEDGDPLAGATFEVYACSKAGTAGHVHSELADASGDSCWMTDLPLCAVTSDGSGAVPLPFLPTGDYQMAETATADGYQLPQGQWLISVDNAAGTVGIEARGQMPPGFRTEADPATGAVSYYLPNYPQLAMPSTGGGALALTVCGVVLVGLAGAFAARRRARR